MRRNFRASVKVFLLILFTLSSYSGYFLIYIVLKICGKPFEPWRNIYTRFWAKGVSRILNITFQVTGTPPASPFILVSNHLSYIDIVPMFLKLKCTFVAKKEVESWPVLGLMIKGTGVIFVDRSTKRDVRRVNNLLSKSLNKHQGIVIFPEGTTTGGDHVLPFRSSLLNYPSSAEIPVHYSALQYKTSENDPPADETVCFYGARDPFHKHVFKMAGNKQITCRIMYGEDTILADDRKELAHKLHEKVEKAAHSLRKEIRKV